jgi:hypothetical protein
VTTIGEFPAATDLSILAVFQMLLLVHWASKVESENLQYMYPWSPHLTEQCKRKKTVWGKLAANLATLNWNYWIS